MLALDESYANWREIVGAVDTTQGGTIDQKNPFRQWLATQDVAYQEKVNGTDSASTISTAIGKFLAFKSAAARSAETPATAPKIAARQDRIAAAITPKGDGGQPAPSKSADDEFNAGFATG